MAIKSVSELAEESFQKIAEYQKGDLKPIRTGREWLDDTFGGLLPGDIVTTAGTSGCVDYQTEFFNGIKWKSIADYVKGDQVLQYNLDGTANMVKPLAYIKKPSTGFYQVRSKCGVDQMVSAEHNMVYMTSKKNLTKKSAEELVDMHNTSLNGFRGKFYTTFDYIPKKRVEIDEDYLRLAICIQADGHYPRPDFYNDNEGGFHTRIRVKKQAKKERIEWLLGLNDLKYSKKDISHQTGAKGFHEYVFYTPEYFKDFPVEWFNLSKRCKEVFWDEYKYWDAYCTPNRLPSYSLNNKGNAELVQFIATSLGYRTSLKEDTHRQNINYTVSPTKRNMCGIAGDTKTNISLLPPVENEYKYCFTVPSGMLVLRRNGSINITGNSGKSYEGQRVKNFIMDPKNNENAENFVWLDHSLEMRLLSNIIRDINRRTKKSKKDIISEEFSEEEKEIVRNYYEQITDGRFFIEEEPSNAADFERNMRAFLSQHKDKDAVFVSIDHIALSKSDAGQKKNAVDGIVEAINKLKKEFPNSYWFILSQLNREIERRSKDKDYESKPNRGDLYQSDTIYHISDYVYVTHNPFKMGINAFMRFNENRYDELEEHFIERKNGKASFDSLGRIFFVVLKIREADAVFQDVYVEEIDIPNIEKYRDSREEKKSAISSSGPPKFGDKLPQVDISSSKGSLNKHAGEGPF